MDSARYACRWIPWEKGRQKKIYMHREILGLPPIFDGRLADHIDGNRLNNQDQNLRVIVEGNQWNRKKSRNNTSGFKCVFWRRDIAKWTVRVMAKRRYIYGGCFSSIIEAANIADDLMVELHGNQASLNFPIIYG
jgi:hypothetical protein